MSLRIWSSDKPAQRSLISSGLSLRIRRIVSTSLFSRRPISGLMGCGGVRDSLRNGADIPIVAGDYMYALSGLLTVGGVFFYLLAPHQVEGGGLHP